MLGFSNKIYFNLGLFKPVETTEKLVISFKIYKYTPKKTIYKAQP